MPTSTPADWRRAATCFPASAWSSAADTARCSIVDPPPIFAFWAARSTTPPARPSTRWPACWGLPFPGGPAIGRVAEQGDPRAYAFPRAFLKDPTRLEFSFSGLKTAVRYAIAGPGRTGPVAGPVVASSRWPTWPPAFRRPWSTAWSPRRARRVRPTGCTTLCVGGGVAANRRLRAATARSGRRRIDFELHIAPPQLCTDNAVMGAIAVERWRAGQFESLDLDVYPGLIR